MNNLGDAINFRLEKFEDELNQLEEIGRKMASIGSPLSAKQQIEPPTE